MDILKKIELYRHEEEKLKWEGTFAEYLEIIREKPWVAQSAHSRVYNMIKDAGIEEENGIKNINFCQSIIWIRGIIREISRRIFPSICEKIRCPQKNFIFNGTGQWR